VKITLAPASFRAAHGPRPPIETVFGELTTQFSDPIAPRIKRRTKLFASLTFATGIYPHFPSNRAHKPGLDR
jgi:hypothetical protein